MNSIGKLFALFNKKQKVQFTGLFIMQFFGGILELLGVSMMLPFVQLLMSPDKLMSKPIIKDFSAAFGITTEKELVMVMLAGMIAIFIIKNVYLILLTYIQYQIVWHNRLKMEAEMMTGYLYKPYMFHVSQNSAETQRIILSDVGSVFEALSNVFFLLSDVITSGMLIVLLFSTDKMITTTIFLLLGFFMLAYFKVFRTRLYQYGKTAQHYSTEVYKSFNQSFHGIKEIKIYECEPYFAEEFRKNRALQISMMKRGNFFQQTPKYFLEMICTAGVLGIILVKVFLGTELTDLVPQLAVFAMAAYRILPSANKINTEMAYINNNKVSIEVVYEARNLQMQELPEIERSLRAEKNSETLAAEQKYTEGKQEEKVGDIDFRDVTFRYPQGERNILEKANLHIEGGKAVAFKGPSGAGKTTTADLLLGILEPNDGVISYNGTDIRVLGRKWFSHLGYIPQSIYLSDDTIRRNVAFGISAPDDEKIWRALEAAQLKEFIAEKPEGLDAMVGEGGIKISGGQRQRIGIARALYNDPEILVLDEATSALDNETEAAVMEAINYLKGKKTLIIIAHRLSTLEKCDRIYEVADGRIEETTLYTER